MTPWPAEWPSPYALHRLAREIVSGDDGAEFVLGHAIIQALRFPPEHSSNLLGWFRRTMTHARIDWLRRSAVRIPLARQSERAVEREAVEALAFDSESIVNELDRAELRELVKLLRSEVESLEGRDREIVQLGFWDGLSVAETAERMGLSESTVRRSKQRVLESIRTSVDGEPTRHGSALLGLAGVPATLWRREPVAAAAVSVGPIALLVAAVFAIVSFFALLALMRGSVKGPDGVAVARLAELGDAAAGPSAEDVMLEGGEAESASRVAIPSREVLDLIPAGVALSGEAAGADAVGEEDADPTQLFVLTMLEDGVPLSGLYHEAWVYDVEGKLVRIRPDDVSQEDAAAGIYRFEVPVIPKAWGIVVSDKKRRVWVEMTRQFSDVPLSETIDLHLVGRSFTYPDGVGGRFSNPHESPWNMIVGVKTLRPATWLMCGPRFHGGSHLNGLYERPYDGFLHFDATAEFGMTFCTKQIGVDPSGLVPVRNMVEIEFVVGGPQTETDDDW